MSGFILNMWIMRRIDEAKVLTYVPKFITQNEADMILATPQGTELDVQGARIEQI